MNSKLVAAIACATATVVTGLAPAANAATFQLKPVLRQEDGDPIGGFTAGNLVFSLSSVFNNPSSGDDDITVTPNYHPISPWLTFAGPEGHTLFSGSSYSAQIDFTTKPLPVAITGVSLEFFSSSPLTTGASREVTASFTNNGSPIPGADLTANDTSPVVNRAISVAAGRSLGISTSVNLNAPNAPTDIEYFIVRFQTQQTTVPEPGNVSGLLVFSLCGIGLMLKRQQTQS